MFVQSLFVNREAESITLFIIYNQTMIVLLNIFIIIIYHNCLHKHTFILFTSIV